MIQRDVDHGYVTARGIAEDYGCEVTPDGGVARAAAPPPSGGTAV
jgi:hypothetical protein